MPARIAGSGTPRFPPRDYPDHPDPHVRFAHIPSASAREAMADYLGLTLETVSRQISALRREGIIELEGKRHVTVPNFDRLLEEAGDDADGGFVG